ncbi:MAG TPA: glycosyltransferase family 4 protein [Candidatus Hydrogenedentes bacterium]|nr:glycosyltransferase family 4 protein [Candidatus Hydrogenedentota bacterium]
MANKKSARIAFVDLLFCWPPQGGADVDLYHVLEALTGHDLDIKLYVPHFEGIMGRGVVSMPQLPFQVEILEIPRRHQNRSAILGVLREAVTTWNPEAVILTHGYALKAHLALALQDYPLAGRYYAHELFCARDSLRFKNNLPCPYNYLDHADICRRCALKTLGPQIRTGRAGAWTQEYLLAEAYARAYHSVAISALETMKRVVVYNHQLEETLGKYRDKAMVIPGGVPTGEPSPACQSASLFPPNKKIVFMSGRAEDPAKGLSVLIEAGARLLRHRQDFHIVITHYDPMWRGPFFSSTGWLDHVQARALMAHATICVVPSLWQEPFGLVAVEAMMAGVPVCASDTGGLRDIVKHQDTGFLFPPGDAGALAHALEVLLDDDNRCRAMGRAGRDRACNSYTWSMVVDNYYLPLIESLLS